MDDLSVILNGLEYKALQLIKKLEHLTKENKEIKEELKKIQNSEQENKLRIKYLEEKNNIIRIANSIEGQENKTKAKLKINELLREVDRCLALLNK
jgi:DNA primase catalytic subunit